MDRPNAAAIGTPANTAAATTPKKKISRFSRPSPGKIGCNSQKPPNSATTTASAANAAARSRGSMRSRAVTIISPTPTGIADARQLIEMLSVISDTIDSLST